MVGGAANARGIDVDGAVVRRARSWDLLSGRQVLGVEGYLAQATHRLWSQVHQLM
jgi:endonuclease III